MRDPDTRLNGSTQDMREGPASWRGEPSRRAESLPVSAEKLVKPHGRRRSPRLARVVAVEISGRGADGKVLVESTSTCNISRHGASLTARTPLPRSASLAILRSGGKTALARVVSVKPGPQPNLQQLGVGFVEEESYWEHEFPPDWQDNDGPAVEDEKPAEEPTAPAAEATRAQEERAGASLVQQAAGTEEKLQNLSRQFEATIQAALEYHQTLAQEGRKAGEIVAQVAASLEAQRKEVAELEEQSARWREQMGTGLNSLQQAAERLIHRIRGEMHTASLASVQEFRKLTPQLVEEASRSFAAEILEKGRTELCVNLDLLRTRTEENQAQIERFAAGQEASLKSRTLELERKLQATAMAQESALQERAAGQLKSLHNAFCAGLEQAAAQSQRTFSKALAAELKQAAPVFIKRVKV